MRKYAKTEHKDTIYSTGEMVAIKKFNKIKVFFLHPIVFLLDKIKVTPNMVSLFSAFTVITGFIISYAFVNPVYFIIGIWIHLLLDCVDGTLARYQKVNSKNGAIVDAICDHFGIVLSGLFIYLFAIVDGTNMIIFIALYSLLIGITINLLKKKKSFLFIIRPRFYVYIAMTIDVFYFIQITQYVVLIANMIMLAEVVWGIIRLLSIKKSLI